MSDKTTELRPLDLDDKLTIETESEFEENTGNEGCGYDSARGSTVHQDRPGRGVGAELAEVLEEKAEVIAEKIKKVVGK